MSAFRLQAWGTLGCPPCCHHCQVTRARGGSSRSGLAVLSPRAQLSETCAPGLVLGHTVCQDPWSDQRPPPTHTHLGKAASTVWVPLCQVMTVPITCPLLGPAATCLSQWQTLGGGAYGPRGARATEGQALKPKACRAWSGSRQAFSAPQSPGPGGAGPVGVVCAPGWC